MTKVKRSRRTGKKNTLITLLLLSLVLAVGVVYWVYPYGQKEDKGTSYEEPTQEEVTAGDDQKIRNIQDEEQRNDPENQNKQTANVIITDAGQYDDIIEVRAFIPDHYQDGTCTITFTQGSQTITKDTPAYRDVSTTICTNPLFNRLEFPSAGQWQLVVRYSSAGASGQSDQQTVTIN